MLNLVAVVFVFGLLIIGHEFGHFTMAKLSGIKVNEFSFGMGPRILKFGKGETEYSWRIFPIGGFVKMLGEEEQVNDPRSFSCKPTLVRMAVIAAGPIMNVIIAALIFGIISFTVGYVKPVVASTIDGYPAKIAGITSGDRIIKVNNKSISTYEEFLMFMQQNGGNPINLVVDRGGKSIKVSITPMLNKEEGRYMIGIVPSQGKASFFEGMRYGFSSTWFYAKEIIGAFKGLFTGKASTEDVTGPVGIIKFAGDAARQGFGSLLMFTAFLSINLAILNLIPFPALDGGWLILLLIEGVRRKKLDADKVGVINFIGFALLMLLTVLVTFRDVLRLNIF